MAKLVVAGTRRLDDPQLVLPAVERGLAKLGLSWSDVEVLMHGDSRGVDRVAAQYAEQQGIQIRKYPADWNGPMKKQAGPYRNYQMAQDCTHLIALWDGESFGTKNMISAAWSLSRKIYVERMDGEKLRAIRLGKVVPGWVKKEALAMTLQGKKGTVVMDFDRFGAMRFQMEPASDLAIQARTVHPQEWNAKRVFIVTLPQELQSEKYLRRCIGEFLARLTQADGEGLFEVNGAFRSITHGLPFMLSITNQELMTMVPDGVIALYREVGAYLYGILQALDCGRIQVDHVGFVPRTTIDVFGTQRDVQYRPPSYQEAR